MRTSPFAWSAILLSIAARPFAGQQSLGFNASWATILPASVAGSVLKQCTREVPARADSTWQPTADQIPPLEETLAPALAGALKRSRQKKAHQVLVNDYYRQYAGLFIDGRQIIYVNGFHKGFLVNPDGSPREGTSSWRTEPLDVCDGGEWFFGAEYDVNAGRVRSLHFNGHP